MWSELGYGVGSTVCRASPTITAMVTCTLLSEETTSSTTALGLWFSEA